MSSIARLVERQMRNWEQARALRTTEKAAPRREVEDFVAISREIGAGGTDVATVLSERMGWPVFDKDILQAMAGDDDVRRQIYASMDERDLGWFERAARAVGQPGFVRDDYFHNLSRTILSLARQARGVFIGRGADIILPREIGVRVRLVAPVEQRIRRLAERRGLETEVARDEVARIDRERAEFIEHHFRARLDDPTRYDLTINMGGLSAQNAVDLILRTHEMRSLKT